MIPIKVKKSPPRMWLIVTGVIAMVVLGIVLLVVKTRGVSEPRLNEPTHVLAKFVSTRAFDNLLYEKQRLYYKMLDDRGNKEIDHAFKSAQISESEYRTALDAAWLGKHINRVEKYQAMSSAARTQYIDELVTKKLKKDGKPGQGGGDDDIDADETAAEFKVEVWPANVREQWKQFHDAYRREKKAREAAATRPAS
jgi:hypothetical protein